MVYVEYIKMKLMRRVFRRRGLEFRMYNERTQRPEPACSGVSRTPRFARGVGRQDARDLPLSETGEMKPRRRCDGSLSGENSEIIQNGCADGICGGNGLTNRSLAMVYSPCQAWRDAYAPDVALSRGTLFSELDLPFEPANKKRGCTIC